MRPQHSGCWHIGVTNGHLLETERLSELEQIVWCHGCYPEHVQQHP